jgi:hypothetical protein
MYVVKLNKQLDVRLFTRFTKKTITLYRCQKTIFVHEKNSSWKDVFRIFRGSALVATLLWLQEGSKLQVGWPHFLLYSKYILNFNFLFIQFYLLKRESCFFCAHLNNSLLHCTSERNVTVFVSKIAARWFIHCGRNNLKTVFQLY